MVKRSVKNHYIALLGKGMSRQFIRLPLGEPQEIRGTGIIEVRGLVGGEIEQEVEGWYYICSERGDCFYLGPKNPHAGVRKASYKNILGYLDGTSSYLSLLPAGVRRERLKAAIHSIIGEDSLAEAALTYILRQRGEEEPAGNWKGSPKYSPWHPDPKEMRDCCRLIRTPSYGFPLSLWNHCKTYRHIAALHGVAEADLKAAVKTAEENLSGPAGLYLFGKGTCDDYPQHAEAVGHDEIWKLPGAQELKPEIGDEVPSWWA